MKNCIILLFILLQIIANAQKSAEYLPEKPGKLILNQYSMNVADELHRNVKHVAGWFIQNAPVMTNPKGFDLWVYFKTDTRFIKLEELAGLIARKK